LSADGTLLATVTAVGATRVWDLKAGTDRVLPTSAGPAVERLAIHPDGRRMLTQQAGAVRIWDLRAPTPAPISSDMFNPVFSTFSQDGRWRFIVDAENRGRLMDAATGKSSYPTFALPGEVRKAAVSADGQRIATVSSDHTVRIWDAATGRPIGKPLSLPHGNTTLTLSLDGRRMFACDDAGAGRLWDTEVAQTCSPLLRLGGPLVAAGIDAAGERIVTVGKQGVVCCWHLGAQPSNTASRPIAEIVALAQLHAGGCLDDQHRFQPMNAAELRAAWEALHLQP
jgi:WD40 repeat protein